MAKKTYQVAIQIPKEMNLSASELTELNEVFQTKLANILSSRKSKTPIPFMPINTSPKSTAKKAAKKTGKGSKNR